MFPLLLAGEIVHIRTDHCGSVDLARIDLKILNLHPFLGSDPHISPVINTLYLTRNSDGIHVIPGQLLMLFVILQHQEQNIFTDIFLGKSALRQRILTEKKCYIRKKHHIINRYRQHTCSSLFISTQSC